MNQSHVYETESGMIFRVTEDDGHLVVEVFKAGSWLAGRIGMVGLRNVEGTKRLTQRQIDRLVG
jgi:hypothetical protein